VLPVEQSQELSKIIFKNAFKNLQNILCNNFDKMVIFVKWKKVKRSLDLKFI